MHQVIIVGAGPAGAYLAYQLAREGIKVLLLEKERLPRSKPCGGAISPKVIKLLDFDLNPIIEDTIYTIVFTHRLNRPVTVNCDQPIVHMVSRERFDAFLVDRAEKAGAEVREGVRVDRIGITDDDVSVYAGKTRWRGSILVGADGAFSIVARSLKLIPNKKYTVTLEKEVPVSKERLSRNRGVIKIDYGLVPSGYTWIFPKAGQLSLGVGTVSPGRKGLRPFLEAVLEAEGLSTFSSGPAIRGWIIPTSSKPVYAHRGRAMLIGDAAGLADAFTGEGIYSALFSAYLAAQVIAEQISIPNPNLQLYTNLVQEKLGNDLANAFRLTRVFYPTSGLIHQLLQHHQGLAADLIHAVAGNINYAQLFNSFRRRLATAWHS